MRLVYKANPKAEVRVGDIVWIDGEAWTVSYFRPPRMPASEGKITVTREEPDGEFSREYYVSVVGAEWVDREDRSAVRMRYRSTDCTFVQFLSAFLACSQSKDEARVLRTARELMTWHHMRQGSPTTMPPAALANDVAMLTDGQCLLLT